MRTYIVKTTGEFMEPYSGEGSEICRHKTTDEYETKSFDQCLQIIKDFLDVPEAELSIEQVRKDFEDPTSGILPEKKLVQIQQYYNGRLAIWRQLDKDLKEHEAKDFNQQTTFKFDIPEQYNMFWCYGDDDGSIKQLNASIEVNVLK